VSKRSFDNESCTFALLNAFKPTIDYQWGHSLWRAGAFVKKERRVRTFFCVWHVTGTKFLLTPWRIAWRNILASSWLQRLCLHAMMSQFF